MRMAQLQVMSHDQSHNGGLRFILVRTWLKRFSRGVLIVSLGVYIANVSFPVGVTLPVDWPIRTLWKQKTWAATNTNFHIHCWNTLLLDTNSISPNMKYLYAGRIRQWIPRRIPYLSLPSFPLTCWCDVFFIFAFSSPCFHQVAVGWANLERSTGHVAV